MKRFVRFALFGLALFSWVPPLCSAHADDLASGARIHQKFKLLPGKANDRYVVYVPFEVKAPGRVRVYHEVTGADPRIDKTAGLPNYILADARVFDKMDDGLWHKICEAYVNAMPTLKLTEGPLKELIEGVNELLGKEDKPKWYHGSRKLLDKTDPLVLDVDDHDLRTTKGRYVVILRNPSPGEYHGNILVSFPGDVWAVDPDLEAAYERKPDLAVREIELDQDNRVVVTLVNEGPGWLHEVRYNPAAERVIRLEVEVNGKKAVSVPLAEVDPKRTLKLKGNAVAYRTEIRLSEPARVLAVIDPDDVVAEPDKKNNKKRENLTPRETSTASAEPGKRVKRGSEGSGDNRSGTVQAGGGMPDLAVADIAIDNRRRVVVRIENRGGGLSPELYRANPQPQIRLLMNGRGWANVPLGSLDPAGALRQPGGSLAWTGEQVPREPVEITVIVDEGNLIGESNRANNTLTKRLSP
ncbi:MAG: hypothetical protein WHT06_14840 [Desulfobacterales bacterium]